MTVILIVEELSLPSKVGTTLANAGGVRAHITATAVAA